MFNFIFKKKKSQDEKLIKIIETYRYEMEKNLIPELKRLKEDHWDKDAFDRLINKYSK